MAGLPSFIVVGAMKAGTSSLSDVLGRHPDIFMPKGEVHFFAREFGRGLDWYRGRFRKAGARRVIGEKSPSYSHVLAWPEAPARMRQALPDVKPIWILREPVARAHSNWWHAVRAGVERSDFPTAVGRELEGRARPAESYLARSRYVEQIEAYLRHFPIAQMHVMLFEDFVRDQARATRAVLAFLGVDPDVPLADPEPGKSNVSAAGAALTPGQFAVATLRFVKGRGVSPIGRRRDLAYGAIEPALRENLAAYFVEPNRELARLTGLDLGPWTHGATAATPGVDRERARRALP
jgi:hypothetical protein